LRKICLWKKLWRFGPDMAAVFGVKTQVLLE
jgi:hypothetical protein